MVDNKKIMPVLVIAIAMFFHGVDIFTEFTITTDHLMAIDIFLAPFGLGGLIRAGHKSYLATKTATGQIPPEDVLKLEEILKKIKN